MVQVLKTTGLIAVLAVSPAFAGGKIQPGQYNGALGKVDIVIDAQRVFGFLSESGACDFEPGRRIFEGQAEGGVVVGTVTLCQRGAGCRDKAYSVMAFYDADSMSYNADVRLDAGCYSPALQDGRLKLSATVDDRGRPRRAEPRRKISKKSRQLAAQAFTNALQYLEQNQFAKAVAEYETGLSYHDENWAGYMGLGHAEFQRGNAYRALDAFDRSRELQPDNPDIHYNMACVHARLGDKSRALNALNEAITLGFALPEQMNADDDLKTLLGDDPEFKSLLKRAWEQKAKQANNR